jgi:uncharacterized membrane protein
LAGASYHVRGFGQQAGEFAIDLRLKQKEGIWNMNRRKFMMGAAVTGIVAGSTMLLADDKKTKAAKHECKGKNDCKGQGGCKTSAAGCAGKNDCKGQGGCSTMKKKKTT